LELRMMRISSIVILTFFHRGCPAGCLKENKPK
jgi:hypothetical protein